MGATSADELFWDVLVQAGAAGPTWSEAARALLAELWEASHHVGLASTADLPCAERFGAVALEADESAPDTVRRVLRLGSALLERAAARGALDQEEAARLGPILQEAAARAVAARAAAEATRRQGWLSLLTHDIKGRLNIVNLNLWLIRQRMAVTDKELDKFEKIERAIERTLELVKEVRELDERVRSPVPQRYVQNLGGPEPGGH